MIGRWFAALGLIAGLSGCAWFQDDPLVFNATQTYGIKIAITAKQDDPVKLVMGYDSVDSTIIPTTMAKKRTWDANGKLTSEERARIYAATMECRLSDPNSSACADSPPPSAPAMGAEVTPDSATGATGSPGEAPAPNSALPPEVQSGRGTQHDSLSVLSSFNAKADGQAGTSPSVGASLGKMFATGVAAQNVSQGVERQMSGGNAACVVTLVNIFGKDKVTPEFATSICGKTGS